MTQKILQKGTVLSCAFISTLTILTASAAIVDTTASSKDEDLAQGVSYTYMDADGSAGKQKINMVTFNPATSSAELKLGLSNSGVAGIQSVLGMAQDADARYQGKVLAGINGGFYRMDTASGQGIPFDFMMQDGEMYTSPFRKPNGSQSVNDGDHYVLAVDENRIPFIASTPTMICEVTVDSQSTRVDHINRKRETGNSTQSYDNLVLYTDKFGSSTLTDSTGGKEVLIKINSGKVKGGDTLNGTVESVSTSGNTVLKKGYVVLSATNMSLSVLEKMTAGKQVSFTFTFDDENWNHVEFATGGTAILVENGVVNENLETQGALYSADNPRTAIGIKADGSIILMTADGRQAGIADGMSSTELGRFLVEQGCVDAVNLDGGGSTTFVGKMPGEDLTLLNVPCNKDAQQRNVANGILLVKNDSLPTKPSASSTVSSKTTNPSSSNTKNDIENNSASTTNESTNFYEVEKSAKTSDKQTVVLPCLILVSAGVMIMSRIITFKKSNA